MTAAGLPAFGFFEFAWIGIPVSVAGMLYMMFIGKHLLPKVELDADQEIEQEIEANSTDSKKMVISGIILLAVVIVMATSLCIHRLGNHLPVRRYDACILRNG